MINLYFINPHKVVAIPDDHTKVFEVVLNKVVEAGWRTNTVTDDILEQYSCFFLLTGKEYIEKFKKCKERLDTFSYRYLSENSFHFHGRCIIFVNHFT